ncbi:PREDICTED: uncharacterized protein LOC104610939 [Nelumbo nucifera]|uniref:NADH dehydrogenase [ubiquinone] 1 alpha subcomplex subunit 12 n=1 Tax=Nelumbo nucifera TaxID=4432 RepID=A0A1U8B589_NELNU|nr:PREDICTED: uncharacterized protein LOC104610939 [Nelumbo nucifera]XP_010276108.1 PREDICTED: uncharacterized protein LOC104610939 [Nelumbo nucifera]XP_010276109.1 PREDICTED: uncharacterized protein LOC104610939 [Nelumbo nucifera]
MSKLFAKISGFFSSRTLVGVDKAGNRYFTRKEEIDGIMKEKRWVIFKGETDPTSIPVEWICWLNGQRKKAPTPEEMLELETRRERVKLNVALLKKEEEERKAKEGGALRVKTGKVGGPDLKSFIRQFPTASTEGGRHEDISNAMEDMRNSQETEEEKIVPPQVKQQPVPSEPTGSGPTFKPGTWQPPT